jgi:tetratricopeptide (TPR) repeat protein
MSMKTEQTKLRLPDIPGSYYDRIMEARWHESNGELEEAVAIYQRLVARISNLPERRRAPGSDLSYFLVAAASDLVAIRATQGDFEAAQLLCEQLQIWDPDDADWWRQRLYTLLIDQGQGEEGLAGLKQLANSEPDKFEHWNVLAAAAMGERQFDLAEQALDRAAFLAPLAKDEDASAQVHLTRYHLYRLQHRWKEAGNEWDKAVELDADVRETQEGVLRMFLGAGLWDDASRYVGDPFPKPVGEYYQGYLAFRRGDKVRARILWRKVVEADHAKDRAVLNSQAMAWCHLGEPRNALSLLLREVSASREIPARTALVLTLGWAMEGNLEAAKADLGMAIRGLSDTVGAKFPLLDWYDFEQLVQDEAIKAELRPHFEDEPEVR